MLTLRRAEGCEFDPRPGQYSRMSFSSDQVTGTVFFFFVIRHSFTIEDLVSAPNLKLGCAVIFRGCASDYK